MFVEKSVIVSAFFLMYRTLPLNSRLTPGHQVLTSKFRNSFSYFVEIDWLQSLDAVK